MESKSSRGRSFKYAAGTDLTELGFARPALLERWSRISWSRNSRPHPLEPAQFCRQRFSSTCVPCEAESGQVDGPLPPVVPTLCLASRGPRRALAPLVRSRE